MATALIPTWRKDRVLNGPYSKEIHRSQAVAACTGDGAILFVGGFGDKGFDSGEVYEFRRSSEHVATERQSEIITLSVRPVKTRTQGPVFRYGHACAMFSQMFVIHGGSRDLKEKDTLCVLDLDRLKWSMYRPKITPPARLYHTMSCLGSTLYVFGGQTFESQYLNDIHTFDLLKIDEDWHHLPVHGSVPAPRSGHTVVVHSTKMYMFGGRNIEKPFNDLWVFDVATTSWTELKPNGHQPRKRVGHSAAIVHGVMYVYGGKIETNQQWDTVSWLEAYHIARKRWYAFRNVLIDPHHRWGHTMTVSGTDIVIFGGWSDYPESVHLVADLEPWVYTLDTSKIDFDQQQPDNPALIQALNQSEDWTQARHLTRYHDSGSLATEVTNVSQSQMVITSLQLYLYYAKPNQYRRISWEARLDTQADGNFMSGNLVDLLGHDVKPYTGRRFNAASGDVTPIGEVSVIFQWQESVKLRKERFLVLPSLPCDIILGNKFISENEVYLFNGSLLVLTLSNITPAEKQQTRDTAAQKEQQHKDEEKAKADQNRAKRDIQRQLMQQSRQQQQQRQGRESSSSSGGG